MQKTQFRQAYHAARIGQINQDTLESIAAIIALQDSRKPDLIGKVYRNSREFLEFIEEHHEKAERLAELKSRRRAKRGSYRVELPEEIAAPIDFDYC
ncbi:MAG TPA: hypothetical protein PK583_04190 [Gammaproteobacteria bacterium]|nr:hypothetical protein [Gammaproteobacteria bacterium]